MQANISKTLEGILARTAFQTAKAAIKHHLKDHLALELLREEGGLAYQLLSSRLQGWELYQLQLRIEQGATRPSSSEPQDPDAFFRRYALELTAKFHAVKRISTAHALLEIASDPTTATAQALLRYALSKERLQELMDRLESDSLHYPDVEIRMLDSMLPTAAKSTTPLLDKLATDLTRQAREGKIDPVIGRDQAIERVIRTLSRRKKNNPILIGEAGVGKTAVVEGLALRMAAGEVPHTLQGKRLCALDVASLLAGTKYRGEFEERMQQLMTELRQAGEVILFIDEIHTIVGAGSTQGSLDTANILKPALARGELQTIGATTLDEYRREIERDSALERRFQRIMIDPPTAEETLRILEQLAPAYAAHHRVHYTAEALQACVRLTDRYLTDRLFPDKAIDLMDEAGARAHLAAGAQEQPAHALVAALHQQRQLRHDALEQGRYEQASTARIEELQLQHRLEHPTPTQVEATSRPVVDVAQIEQVITELTGIPIERIGTRESDRLQHLHHHLQRCVVGQQTAVQRLSQAILRARAGLKATHRPIGVFLFVGPTGVGKTLLAKELSKWLFDEQRGLIRLDMSEYGEKHNVARLIGSPPGYVGYGEGGQLTEAVRRRPYAVVLFDEIEKAHPDLFNTLLQLFDEGHLTDGAGRKVDFRNTVIIMTSNVGSRTVAEQPNAVGYTTLRAPRTKGEEGYRKALERTFAPEFLNRIDEVVLFRELEGTDVVQIIELELAAIIARTEALGYRLTVTEAAKQELATRGYEVRFGARSLKRTLTDHLETPLSELIVSGRLRIGDQITLDHTPTDGLRLKVA